MNLLFVMILSLTLQAKGQNPEEYRKRVAYKTMDYSNDDIKAEIRFGRNLAARILGRYKMMTDKKVNRYVKTMGTGIASLVGRPELDYHFAVLETNDINAYACPGGYVFVTYGAIKQMNNEAQLAGVIAHEITHINSRHVVKELKIKGNDTSALSGFANLTSGATSTVRTALEQALDKAYKLLMEKGISQKDEFESDAKAVGILANIGYDPRAYRQYLTGINYSKKEGNTQILSKTHPSIKDRLAKIDILISKFDTDGKYKINKKRFEKNVLL